MCVCVEMGGVNSNSSYRTVSCLISGLQSTFGWELQTTRASFVFIVDSSLKCLTCISWFELNFGMKPRLPPGNNAAFDGPGGRGAAWIRV